MRNRRWAVALAGVLASARAARALDVDTDVESARAAPATAALARWLTLETPHFELHFYPEEREFASGRRSSPNAPTA